VCVECVTDERVVCIYIYIYTYCEAPPVDSLMCMLCVYLHSISVHNYSSTLRMESLM